MTRHPTRRRFLSIMGVAASGALLGSAPGHARWHGTALGADAEMVFAGATPAHAESAITTCLAELERLERIFSLYRGNSELVRLNREGRLNNPSRDLVILLQHARRFSAETFGAFDCTVQPVWRELARQFSGPAHKPQPDRKRLNETLRHVGHEHIEVTDQAITLNAGTSVTLNGIAQGYITDRIADALQASGWRDALINMGEYRALPGKALAGAGKARRHTPVAFRRRCGHLGRLRHTAQFGWQMAPPDRPSIRRLPKPRRGGDGKRPARADRRCAVHRDGLRST